MKRSEAQGRMYCGDLKNAIAHFTENIGEPVVIYCNKGEFRETDLVRITDLTWPDGIFILSQNHPRPSKSGDSHQD